MKKNHQSPKTLPQMTDSKAIATVCPSGILAWLQKTESEVKEKGITRPEKTVLTEERHDSHCCKTY